ncbi:hypothetical protein KFE98_08195 [bacterium SCSIO 12741]|nr:hypothetical protein KFE98_08195 [bacterium SCSIO 12741]
MEKSPNDRLEKMLEIVREMLDENIKDAKLVAIEFLALMLGALSTKLMMASLALIGLLFLAFGAGNMLNEMFNSTYLGYFAMAGFFLVVILLLQWIQSIRKIPYFTNSFIRLFVSLFYYGEKKD